jgi:pyruvate/2-oxoglutarate dehydrogenase complex dihydrolipoamide dehydrogenase (E3) component
MAIYDYDLGIIGGGAAGLTAAAGAAQFGAKTLLIEKSASLGGDCLHFGCVPSKTLIHTAKVYSLMKKSKEFGLPDMPPVPVNLESVMNHVSDVINKIQQHDSPERFCQLGAQVRFGNPEFIDDHQIKFENENISAKNWIIATGSSAAIPPIPGIDKIPYWTNETVFRQKILPATLAILGGGPIGLELAQAFSRLGSKVTIFEFTDQILGPEDIYIAEILQSRLEEEGIKILTSTKVINLERVGSSIKITFANGVDYQQISTMTADALIVATGRKPNITDLNLAATGVKFTGHGIPTDLKMRTNIQHIYACGDVNGKFLFTHVAGYEAGIALTNAIVHLPRKANYDQIGWCTYTDPEIASIGLNEKRARKLDIEYHIWEENFDQNDRAQATGETTGKIKILVNPSGKLIGCQIIGANAGELIHEWILAMQAGVKLSTIASAVHIYPTLSEISKRVAGSVYADKIFSEKTRHILKFLFNLKGRACFPSDKRAD